MFKAVSKKFLLMVATILATNSEAFEFGKPVKVLLNKTGSVAQAAGTTNKKEIVLTRINLTAKEQQTLFNYNPSKKNLLGNKLSNLPSVVNLGMNNVPVLNQGMHGTCATFATTAIIDAELAKGDYISQLCQLELGSTLEKQGYYPSGWDGNLIAYLIDQMMRYGVINKEKQKTQSCAGITEYPLANMSDTGRPMLADDYKLMSEDISTSLYPIYLMSYFQRLDPNFPNTNLSEYVFNQVKTALHDGNRILLGYFLFEAPYCEAGACATFHTKNDTWALTKEIETPSDTDGHAIVIYGYDDNAVAVDAQGNQHKGLFLLRNSWTRAAGDHGDYYMSYDYFKKFSGEVVEIAHMKK